MGKWHVPVYDFLLHPYAKCATTDKSGVIVYWRRQPTLGVKSWCGWGAHYRDGIDPTVRGNDWKRSMRTNPRLRGNN